MPEEPFSFPFVTLVPRGHPRSRFNAEQDPRPAPPAWLSHEIGQGIPALQRVNKPSDLPCRGRRAEDEMRATPRRGFTLVAAFNGLILPKAQVKDRLQGQRCFNDQVGIGELGAALLGSLVVPLVEHVLTEPDHQAAALDEGLVVLAPIAEAVRGFVLRFRVVVFLYLAHGR